MVFIANDLDKCDNYISIKNSTDEHDTQTQPAQTPRPCTMYVQCMYNEHTFHHGHQTSTRHVAKQQSQESRPLDK